MSGSNDDSAGGVATETGGRSTETEERVLTIETPAAPVGEPEMEIGPETEIASVETAPAQPAGPRPLAMALSDLPAAERDTDIAEPDGVGVDDRPAMLQAADHILTVAGNSDVPADAKERAQTLFDTLSLTGAGMDEAGFTKMAADLRELASYLVEQGVALNLTGEQKQAIGLDQPKVDAAVVPPAADPSGPAVRVSFAQESDLAGMLGAAAAGAAAPVIASGLSKEASLTPDMARQTPGLAAGGRPAAGPKGLDLTEARAKATDQQVQPAGPGSGHGGQQMRVHPISAGLGALAQGVGQIGIGVGEMLRSVAGAAAKAPSFAMTSMAEWRQDRAASSMTEAKAAGIALQESLGALERSPAWQRALPAVLDAAGGDHAKIPEVLAGAVKGGKHEALADTLREVREDAGYKEGLARVENCAQAYRGKRSAATAAGRKIGRAEETTDAALADIDQDVATRSTRIQGERAGESLAATFARIVAHLFAKLWAFITSKPQPAPLAAATATPAAPAAGVAMTFGQDPAPVAPGVVPTAAPEPAPAPAAVEADEIEPGPSYRPSM